ncbi:hypothetical protein DY000_02032813 [Brassica cretica]|uniref:Transmembrane protein n=1 Tax=Brassica cretica TaxID=69181 RepID=A0ABQ7DH56_BRACR|nr:hypothetical protein DY000_02032813 [Brassica cretica]
MKASCCKRELFGCRNSILLNVEFGCYWLMVNASAFAVSILLNVEFGCYWLMVNASVVFLVEEEYM